jgi:predicted metal-dependent phosphoesterase TrpH
MESKSRREKMNAFRKIALLALFFLFPLFLTGGEIQFKVISSADDLPEKFSTAWMKGDFLVSDGKSLALVGGAKRTFMTILNAPSADAFGSIVAFVPAGKQLETLLCVGSPIIRIKKKTQYLTYESVKPLKESLTEAGLVFEAVVSFTGEGGEKAQVKTHYRFIPQEGRIDITSSLVNTGTQEFKDLNYSLYFNAFHSYSFRPFHRKKHPDLNFRVFQKKGHYLAWLDMNPLPEVPEEGREPQPVPGKLAPKQAFEVRHILLVDSGHEKLLEKIYKILQTKTQQAVINFKDSGGEIEVIVSDAFSSSLFFRSFLENPFSFRILLPAGTYKVTANFFPAVVEELLAVSEGEENSCLLQNPPLGRVKVRTSDSKGEYVPGKVTFIGLSPTKSPYFKPENPVKSGRSWESYKNSCFPPEEGLEVKLPVGTYLVHASRGPEYSVDQKVIEVLKDELQELNFSIDRVVETSNLISIDPHLHTFHSDGQMSIAERIKSVVAEGVDVAVASDHNLITDYYPTLKKIGLNKYLAVILGNEVTHPFNLIHYNTYPLKYRAEEENNGAISPVAEEASELFEASRKKDPQAILQVNHPRAGDLGYFNNYGLDIESAAFAREHFDTSFELLEVMNGPYFYSSNSAAINDWLHLLNRGYYFPLVGSSDSHSIDRGEPGYSRTYVSYQGGEADNLDWNAISSGLKKGRSFATNGPLVEFKVNTKYTSGDTFSLPGGKAEVWIRVQSAPWISVDEVRLVVNGERKVIFPVKAEKKATQKFEEQISLTLKKDSYLAVEVLGNETLYPVLQQMSRSGLMTNAVIPYALTNPVFIDVNGNGKFDPPLTEKVKLVADTGQQKEPISRY